MKKSKKNTVSSSKPQLEERFCISYDKKLRSKVFSEFSAYFRSGLFCDVAIYCPVVASDDLSSLPTVEQDIWLIPDGPELGLATRWAKIRCHSLILSTLSPMLKRILLSHSPSMPVCNCNCLCDALSHSQELYSIVLPDSSAKDIIRLLNQAYTCASVFGRVNFKISRDIYELFELTSDNPWESDDFGDSESGPIQTIPLGICSSEPVPINEQVQRIKEKLVLKRKRKSEPESPMVTRKMFKPNTEKDKQLAMVKKEARQRGGKLRVVLNRISHPSLTRIRIDLGHQYKSNQQLPIPETVAHVFSDILENSERQKKIILGPVQTITKDAFISIKIKDIETIANDVDGPMMPSLHPNPTVSMDHEYTATTMMTAATTMMTTTRKNDSVDLINKIDASPVKRVMLKPISHQEVMARLGQMPNTLAASPVVLKKLNIKNTVYKGYSRVNPVVVRRDIIPDPNESANTTSENLVSKPLHPGNNKYSHHNRILTNNPIKHIIPLNIPKELADRYTRLASKFIGRQLLLMSKFLPQSKIEFDPVTPDYEYSNEMLDAIVSSSGKISVVTIDHDRNQIFVCPICDKSLEEHGVDAYCRHVINEHKTKPRVECQECGKQCFMTINFIPHTFQHRLLDFSESGTVALLGISSRQGKNVACTLACNHDGWNCGNSLFNFMKAMEIVFRCSTEKLYDLLKMEKKTGKTSGTDPRVSRIKDQYDQLGLTPIQLQAKLEEFLTRDPNMFERKGPGAARNPVHTPQIPAFTFQVRADFELVSAISFDELLDVAIVYENKQTKQLEIMSAVRMAFQSKYSIALAIPSNFASLMTPVLARLLNCSGVEEMKAQLGHLFQEYFQEFQNISNDVFALREILNTVQCPQCDRAFHVGSNKGRFLYETHKEMHLFADCDCNISVKSGERKLQHMRLVHGYTGDQVPDSCECKAAFKSVKNKALHMKKVHGIVVPLFNCTTPNCTMAFVTETNRDAHLKAGNHQIQTVCDQCGKSFESNCGWKLHRTKNHKQFSCTICQKTLYGSKSLKYHTDRCATGSWKCHICKRIYASEEELEEHSRLSHIQDNSITATCSVCFRGFRKLEYLRNHEKRVHFRPPNARGRHVGKKRTKVKPPGASKSTTRGKKTTQVVVGEISQPRQGQSVNTLHIGSPVTLATLNSSNVIHNQFYMD